MTADGVVGKKFPLASNARTVSTAAVNPIGVAIGNRFWAQHAEHPNPIAISDSDPDSNPDCTVQVALSGLWAKTSGSAEDIYFQNFA